MIEKIKKYIKTAIAGVLALSLVLQAFHGMQYVLANEETTGPATYTVTLTEAAQVFIYNDKAPNGAVTLTYTVQSAEKTCRQNGVIATTNPEADYPYLNGEGNMKHKITTTLLYSVGATYKVQMSLDAEGKVQYSAERSKPGETLTSPTLLDNDEGTGNTNATHFGIWLDLGDEQGSPETAVLTNVSCVDAAGNDLGVKVKAATGTCEAVKDEIEEPEEPIVAETYTVTLTNAAQVFICNDKAPIGAVTLTYTVQSASRTCYQNGAIATTDPEADYPFENGKGHMRFLNGRLWTYRVGATYQVQMSLDADGKIQYSGGRTYPDGSTDSLADKLTAETGTANKNATYFGIWLSLGGVANESPETAVLTNVSCVDAAGNDLGVKVKAATGTCKAVKDEIEEPEEPSVAETYTVTLTNAAQVFICNDKAPEGTVTLTYTVQSASRTCYQNGAIATTDPEADYPHLNGKGHMRFLNGRLWTYQVGATYKVQMSLDADGKIQYSGGRTYPDGSTDSLANKLTAETGTANKDATYFGIWISLRGETEGEGPETAVLTNVSCVDAAGNDLGVKVKATTGTCEAIKHETVTLDAKYETYKALPYLLSGEGDLTVNGEVKENGHTLTQVGDYEIQWDYYGRITKQKIVIYQLGNAHLDENIDVCDLVAIKKEADEHYLDTEAAMLGADVNDSKTVDDVDVTKMREVLVGTATLDEPAAVSYALNDTSVMPIAGYYGPCG